MSIAAPSEPQAAHAVLELTVRNHPGVMSQVCGLFARRAYNVDGILCMPLGDAAQSRIWLKVAEQARLDQLIKQLNKLEDVLEIRRHAAGHEVFVGLEAFFGQKDRLGPAAQP